MIKRIIDIAASSIVILMILPLLLFIGLLVFLYDGKSPLFSQLRYGRIGHTFRIWKYRTMRMPVSGEKRQIEDIENDSRVTGIGRFLRATHFDELPQLFNILKGDMSIVGPRPIPCGMNFDKNSAWETRRKVRPGLTGLAQSHCTKYTTLSNKFRYDVLYVKRASWWLDIKIVVATAWKVRKMLVFVSWTVVILALTLLPIAESDIPGIGLYSGIDKVAHFGMFAIMVLAAAWLARSYSEGIYRPLCFAIIWGLLLGGFTEYAQSFVPLRNMSLHDFVADAGGIGWASCLVYMAYALGDNTNREIVNAEVL